MVGTLSRSDAHLVMGGAVHRIPSQKHMHPGATLSPLENPCDKIVFREIPLSKFICAKPKRPY